MIIAINSISFHKGSERLLFTVKNSVGKDFGITSETKITLNDKDTDIERILVFFRTVNRPIAEIDFVEDSEYHLRYINFLALE